METTYRDRNGRLNRRSVRSGRTATRRRLAAGVLAAALGVALVGGTAAADGILAGEIQTTTGVDMSGRSFDHGGDPGGERETQTVPRPAPPQATISAVAVATPVALPVGRESDEP